MNDDVDDDNGNDCDSQVTVMMIMMTMMLMTIMTIIMMA